MQPVPDPFGPPWHTAARWQEVNAALVHLLQRHRTALDRCRDLARRLERRRDGLGPLMDELCRATCPDCRTPCCATALVWFDFRDLLFLHLAGLPLPACQPRYPHRRHCRFLSPDGCLLPRSRRPWLCTWYLCPPQTAILRSRNICLDAEMEAIKSLRQELEDEFIAVIHKRLDETGEIDETHPQIAKINMDYSDAK